MKTLGLALLAAIVGYLAGMFCGMFFIETFSSNPHDRSLEAAMTGAFVIGPVVAMVFVIVVLLSRSRRTGPSVHCEENAS